MILNNPKYSTNSKHKEELEAEDIYTKDWKPQEYAFSKPNGAPSSTN